jgi:UDP:flavonoid glycosyltransferase YjiC (YdhE family)
MTRVLITPLDWGLGHATRCIPVIREFERQGCEVTIAGSGDSLALLQKEFPAIRSFSLPGYRPSYPLQGTMVWTMARQLPRFVNVISHEHHAMEKIIEAENIDLIISDNRYGCWSSRVYSVFITHQSNILMPKRFGWLQTPVRKLNEKLIARFDTCWVPDLPEGQSLAGILISNAMPLADSKTEFIGWLSRFERNRNAEKKIDVAAIFSGPEPQRTQMEKAVVSQLEQSGLSYRAVRGLPSIHSVPTNKKVVNFLPTQELQACIESADIVIARSGYSTVMDMQRLGKKVIFIPTPGQTEQEYLANRLKDKGIAFFMNQNDFDLRESLQQAKHYRGFDPLPATGMLRDSVASLLKMRS